jgi:hypothetical protein
MLKSIISLFKRSIANDERAEDQTVRLQELLKNLEGKEEMKMLVRDYHARNKADKGGGSASSPVSSS